MADDTNAKFAISPNKKLPIISIVVFGTLAAVGPLSLMYRGQGDLSQNLTLGALTIAVAVIPLRPFFTRKRIRYDSEFLYLPDGVKFSWRSLTAVQYTRTYFLRMGIHLHLRSGGRIWIWGMWLGRNSHVIAERIAGQVLCVKCRYDLRGIPSKVCPECGTPFLPLA